MSKVIHLKKRDDKLKEIHEYFLDNNTSMLIILGKHTSENIDILMEVAYKCGDLMKKMRVIDNSFHKFAFHVSNDILKIVYFADTMSLYIEDMAEDWKATILNFEKQPIAR